MEQKATVDKGYSKRAKKLDICICITTDINKYATSRERYNMQRDGLRPDSTNSPY